MATAGVAGPRCRQGVSGEATGSQISIPDVGDFDRTQPFTASALGEDHPRATPRVPSSPAWTRKNKYRGWDLWIEGDKIGTHIINALPEDALKVVGNNAAASQPVGSRRRHLRRLGQSRRRQGLRQRPACKPHDHADRHAQEHHPHRGAVQDRPAAAQPERLFGEPDQDVRLYDRALDGQSRSINSSACGPPADALAKPADKRTPAETDELLRLVAGRVRQDRVASSKHRFAKLQTEEAAIKAAAPSPTS